MFSELFSGTNFSTSALNLNGCAIPRGECALKLEEAESLLLPFDNEVNGWLTSRGKMTFPSDACVWISNVVIRAGDCISASSVSPGEKKDLGILSCHTVVNCQPIPLIFQLLHNNLYLDTMLLTQAQRFQRGPTTLDECHC